MSPDTQCAFVYPEGHEREGERCRGTRVRETGLCPGHSGLGLAKDSASAAEAARLQGEARRVQAEARTEARKATYADRLARLLDAHAAEIEARLLEVLRDGSDADFIKLLSRIEDRVMGRPTERVEQIAPEPKTLEELRSLSREERRALLLRLETERGGESLLHAVDN